MKAKIIVSSLIAAGVMATSSLAMAGAAELDSCCTPTDQDFPKNGGNLGNQSYTGLTQITKDNINKLGPVWIVHVSAVPATTPAASPGTSSGGQQTTPVAVDGVVFTETPDGDVIAVDGATGAVKWKWHPTVANSGFGPTGTRRGLSVGGGRVYTLAAGNRVVALDQKSGAQIWAVVPPPPAGETTLGNIAKVATTYYNGKVYIGTNDANRNAIFALNAATGAMVWTGPFYGGAKPGTVVTDVNGKTWYAGDSWMCATDGSTPCPAGTVQNTCALTAGASPWIHGAIDPALNMVYVAFGNARSCGSSQDASGRPGTNLFSNSLVALDAETGAYKWHFQTNNHGQWDMDNTNNPTMADVIIGGQLRKVIYNGTKQGRTFVLDRTNGLPALPVEHRTVVQDSRQKSWPTQPYPAAPQQAWLPDCIAYQNLGSEIPGLVHRAVPNYNGYQAEPDPANPGQLRLVYNPTSYIAADDPFVTSPYPDLPKHRGCMNEATWDLPVLSTPSQNGGADWSGHSFSQKLGLYYIPYGTNPSAHDRFEGGNGLRPLGQYQTGGIVAMNGSTNQIVWKKELGLNQAHGVTPLATATDLLFMIQTDGYLVAWDAATGEELWRFQTGVSGSSGVISYMVNGEQYIGVLAAATGIPYNPAEGDNLWAFKLGGNALYKDAAGNVVSGSSEAPTPTPLTLRRPINAAAVEGSTVNNTVYLARISRTTDTALVQDGLNGNANPNNRTVTANAMSPQHLRVPVGTTVTFLNPGPAQFQNFPNLKAHCGTQFFEGLFNEKVNPGESFTYTFNRAGEYFYNDCTDPRPTGKVVAYLVPQDVPGAVRFTPSNIDMEAEVFTQVDGVITAHFDVPEGYTPDGGITLRTPLSATLFRPVSSNLDSNGGKLVAQFSKADIDNNVPTGNAVPLVFTANFISGGVQKQLTSTATVKIVK
jgi:quinohemoprotein ethanol dehydrogenase